MDGDPARLARQLVIRKSTVRLYDRSAGRLVGWLLLFTATSPVVRAGAHEEPERTRARALGYAGVEAYSADDFATASVKLEEAYRLVAVPSLGLWSARSLVKLGKWVEAEERYRSVAALVVSASDSDVQRAAQDDAARELQALLSEIPVVLIELSGARSDEVTASLDGVPVDTIEIGRDIRVNPGRHVLTGMRGAELSEQVFDLKARERKQVRLRFSAVPGNIQPNAESNVVPRRGAEPEATPQATLRTAGWIALAAGGAGLATGSFAYWMGRREYTNLERQNWCVNDTCDPNDVQAYNTWRAVHLAGIIGGGVLGAAGVGLLLAMPVGSNGADPKTTVTFRFDSRTLIWGGRF